MKIIHSGSPTRGVGYVACRNLVRFLFDSEPEFQEFQKKIPATIWHEVYEPISEIGQMYRNLAGNPADEDDFKWQIDIRYYSGWSKPYSGQDLSDAEIADLRIKGEVAKNKKIEKFLFEHGVINLEEESK